MGSEDESGSEDELDNEDELGSEDEINEDVLGWEVMLFDGTLDDVVALLLLCSDDLQKSGLHFA